MYKAKINNKTYDVKFENSNANRGQISNSDFEIDIIKKNNSSYHIIKNYKSYNVNILSISNIEKTIKLKVNNNIYDVEITDEIDALLNKMGIKNQKPQKNKDLKSPMPGLVRKILVKIGDEIKKGDTLLILEAMKMENNLKSDQNGTIKDIVVESGNSVEKNQLLIIFE